MKLTPWFDGNVKPVREGVYERIIMLGTLKYSYFKNGTWYSQAEAKSTAVFFSKNNDPSICQQRPRRGVIKSPQEVLDIYTKKLRDSIKLHGGK